MEGQLLFPLHLRFAILRNFFEPRKKFGLDEAISDCSLSPLVQTLSIVA